MGLVGSTRKRPKVSSFSVDRSRVCPFLVYKKRKERKRTVPRRQSLRSSFPKAFTLRLDKKRSRRLPLSSKTVGTVGGAVKRDLLSTPFLLNKRAFDATERAFVKLETKRRSSKRFFFRCAPLKFSRRRRPPFSRFRFKVATTGSLSLSLSLS